MSTSGRHSSTGHRWLPALLLGLVVAAMVISAGFVGWFMAGNSTVDAQKPPTQSSGGLRNDDSAGGFANGGSAGGNAGGGSAGSPGNGAGGALSGTSAAEALDACQALYARQLHVALAADASLDQWRLHIQAMNQLVAGAITLDQATAYWERTRIGARHNALRFEQTNGALQDSRLSCSAWAGQVSSPTQRQLADCRLATSGINQTMAAAETTVTTWMRHIHDMNLLRVGKITPEEATTMWIQSWHSGARELHRYDSLATKSLDQKCT